MYGEAYGHNGFGEMGVWWNPGSWGKGTRSGGYCDRVERRYKKEMSRVRSGDESREKKAQKHLSRAQREKCPWSRKVTKKKQRKGRQAERAARAEEQQYQQSQMAMEQQAQAEIEAQRAMIASIEGTQAGAFDWRMLVIPMVGVVGLVVVVAMMRKK